MMGPKGYHMPGYFGAPEEPSLSEKLLTGENACLRLAVNRYADWADPKRNIKEVYDATHAQVPPFLHVKYLGEADESDPGNHLRVLSLAIAKRLGYRLVITDMAPGTEAEKLELLIAGLVMIGVEHSAEIRDAIAAEREARK
jgi:hypothetical protein